MLNQVPFTKNPDEWHCIHAAMHGVIKHFAREYCSLDYLNALMNSERELWVWPFQAVKALHELGLFVRMFSQYDFKVFSNIDSIEANFPEVYSELTDINSLRESCNFVAGNSLHVRKVLSIAELEQFIHDGCVPIVILGIKKRVGKYVAITGYDSKNFYYHDSGPHGAKPHKAMSKEDFLDLWMKEPSRNVVIMVYGKRFQDSYTRFNF